MNVMHNHRSSSLFILILTLMTHINAFVLFLLFTQDIGHDYFIYEIHCSTWWEEEGEGVTIYISYMYIYLYSHILLTK